MTRRPVALLLAFLAQPATGQASASAADVLTLDDAVALALRNNLAVKNAALQVERSDASVQAAKARRLPAFDLEALAGRTLTPIRVTVPGGAFGDFPATGPIPRQDIVVEAPRALSAHLSATIAQPLSQLYKIGLGVQLSELARALERERLRGQRSAIASDVKRVYYGLLQTESALEAARIQVQTCLELDRVVSDSLAREAVLPGDSLEVKARLAAEEYKQLRLQNSLASQKEQMNVLLGRELGHEFTPVTFPEASPEELDPEAAVERALERRPELTQARLQARQADTARRVKKAESLPEVGLAFTYLTFTNVDLLPRNIAQVGVQLKWEPFDWGRRGKELAEKTLQLEQARNGVRLAEDQVRLEVGLRLRRAQEARLLLEANRLARDSAREKLRVARNRQQADAVLLKDVLQAQAALSDADAQYAQAQLTLWTSKAELETAVGEDQ
jgi:outer membrane protein